MRIHAATIPIDRQLWRDLSRPLGLAQDLPGALVDSLQMYGSRRLLIGITRTLRDHDRVSDTVCGSYAFGRIKLVECPRCTFAFVTWVLLHELFHAWAHQYHEDFYETVDHCERADLFANRAFGLLGGKRNRSCGKFELPFKAVPAGLAAYREYAAKAVRRGVE